MKYATRRAAVASCLLSLSCLAGTALAQVSVYEGFDYAPGALLGQSGGHGFHDAWQTAGYGAWSVASSDAALVQAGRRMITSGGHATTSSGGYQRTLELAQPLGAPGTSAWISFIAQRTSGPSDASWLGVKLPCTGSEPYLFLGKPWGQSSWGCDNGRGVVRSTEVQSSSRVRIVARIDFRDGPDDVSYWIKPSFDNPPLDVTANLRLPAYGDFRGITKALIECGGAQGMIDELRIGSSYAEVTPVSGSVIVDGLTCSSLDGSALEAAPIPGTARRAARTGRNPQTGRCSMMCDVSSLGGAELLLSPPSFAAGASISGRYRGWDGTIRGTSRISSSSSGDLSLSCDLTPSHATGARVRVTDSGGSILMDEVISGADFARNIPGGQLSGPCPDGGQPGWYLTYIMLSEPEISYSSGFPMWVWFKEIWVYGCPGPIISHHCTIEITPLFSDVSSFTPGLSSVEVEASGVPYLDVSSAAIVHRDLAVRGLGDVLVNETCSNGACSDPASRRWTVQNIGSSGQDGVEISSLDFAPLFLSSLPGVEEPGAAASFGQERRGPVQGVHFTSVDLTGKGNRRVGVTPRFSSLSPEVEVLVLDDLGGVIGHTTLPSDVEIDAQVNFCPPPGVPIWGWMNWNNQIVWGIYACAGLTVEIDNPHQETWRVSGPRVIVRPVNDPPIVDMVVSTLTASNLTGDVTITEMSRFTPAPTCPADFNGDSFLDFFDYDDFVVCFETGACPAGKTADFNGDQFVDFFDYDDFVIAFETGC